MDSNAFNTSLAKRLQNLKADLGATKVRQGYKGTGSKTHRRQIWVDFPNDRTIDLWLDGKAVGLGGVCHTNFGKVLTMRYPTEPETERSIDDVYAEIVDKLRPLANLPPREVK